jgi:hypothetical protein
MYDVELSHVLPCAAGHGPPHSTGAGMEIICVDVLLSSVLTEVNIAALGTRVQFKFEYSTGSRRARVVGSFGRFWLGEETWGW